MKRIISLLLATTLLSAAGTLGATAHADRHRVEMQTYDTYFENTEDVLPESFPLYFLDGVYDLPYVEVYDWAEMMYLLYNEYMGDYGYELYVSEDGSVVTYERENGYYLDMDFRKNTLLFSDYNGFVHDSTDSTLLDIVSERGFGENGQPALLHRDILSSYDRYGDMLEISLGEYGIDLIEEDGSFYVPLQTMNDFLILNLQESFLFNGEVLILANDELLFDYENGEYTDLAELYYSAPAGKRSDELADYSYSELCAVLDTFYGLKEPHDIEYFSQLFWEIGYDEPMSGNSAEDADNALKSFIDYYLDDLHSVFNEYSYLSGFHDIESSTGMSNRKYDAHAEKYAAVRDEYYPDGVPGYEEIGNTAYVTFDNFYSYYTGETFYEARASGEQLDDTVALIIYAHEQISRPGSPVENVVLDLSNNSGGDVDAAVFVLGWMLGDAPFSIKDMATGAMSISVYRVDTNLDRIFDERDTVCDKNLYCLISPVSFSCGNLVPAALKGSQQVTLIGKTTGGGSCAVQPMSTAYGSVFQISSSSRMSFMKNGSFYDIDQGVDPDYYLDKISSFYNREALTDYINGLI